MWESVRARGGDKDVGVCSSHMCMPSCLGKEINSNADGKAQRNVMRYLRLPQATP